MAVFRRLLTGNPQEDELNMRKLSVFAAAFILCACATQAPEAPQEKITSEVLVQSTRSWDGGKFAYPAGEGQLTVTRIIMPKGSSLPMHCHPVPLAGMVTRGQLEVLKEDGQTMLIGEGAGLIEVSNQWHFGTAREAVEIVVVYAGNTELPVTVFKDGDPALVANCR